MEEDSAGLKTLKACCFRKKEMSWLDLNESRKGSLEEEGEGHFERERERGGEQMVSSQHCTVSAKKQ